MELTRRNFFVNAARGTAVIGGLTFEAACFNATGLLEKIDSVTKAAIAVVNTLVTDLGPGVTLPYVPLVQAWLSSIEGANTKALAIANGAAKLTGPQITQIVGIYAGALAFNIPGVPAAVTTVINAVVAAVDVLLSFLGATPTQTAAFRRGDFAAVPAVAAGLQAQLSELPTNRGFWFKEHVRSSIALNKKLGDGIAKVGDMLSAAKPSTAAAGYNAGGFNR